MTTLDPGRKSWNFAHDSKPGTCTPVCHHPHQSKALWFSLLVTWGWCNQYGSHFSVGIQLSDHMLMQGKRQGAFDSERHLTLVFRGFFHYNKGFTIQESNMYHVRQSTEVILFNLHSGSAGKVFCKEFEER